MVGSGSTNRGVCVIWRRPPTVDMSSLGVHRRPPSIFWHLRHYGSSSEIDYLRRLFALLFDEASVSPIDGEIQQAGAKNCSNSAQLLFLYIWMSVDRKFLFLRPTLVLTLLMQEIAQTEVHRWTNYQALVRLVHGCMSAVRKLTSGRAL